MSDQGNVGPRAAQRAGKRGWLWWAFVLSLSLNLLVAGFFIGAKISHHGWPPWGDHGFSSFAHRVDGERQQLFRELTQSYKEHWRSFRRDIRNRQIEAVQLLKVDPFDREKFVAALDDIIAERVTARRALSEQFLAMIDKMTPEERRAYAEWYEEWRASRKR